MWLLSILKTDQITTFSSYVRTYFWVTILYKLQPVQKKSTSDKVKVWGDSIIAVGFVCIYIIYVQYTPLFYSKKACEL